MVGGGDGMFNVVDPEDSRWLYNASQNGAIQRVDQRTGTSRSIRPMPPQGRPAYRFNWTAPIHVSPHNSRTIYIGAQVLLRSVNRGDSWREISPDLTTNDPEKLKGNIEFCTLTTDRRVARHAGRDLDGIRRREGAGDEGRGREVDRRDGEGRGGRRPGRLLRDARGRVAAQGGRRRS